MNIKDRRRKPKVEGSWVAFYAALGFSILVIVYILHRLS